MTKKKAVQKSEAPDEIAERKPVETKANEITGQAAEAVATAVPKESRNSKKRKKKRPVRCIQQHTDVEFRREFRGVCKSLIKKAKGGGIQETRLLLQIGKFGDPKIAKRRGAKSLSAMLLDELKRRQDEREAAVDGAKSDEQISAVNEASNGGATSGSDVENG